MQKAILTNGVWGIECRWSSVVTATSNKWRQLLVSLRCSGVTNHRGRTECKSKPTRKLVLLIQGMQARQGTCTNAFKPHGLLRPHDGP